VGSPTGSLCTMSLSLSAFFPSALAKHALGEAMSTELIAATPSSDRMRRSQTRPTPTLTYSLPRIGGAEGGLGITPRNATRSAFGISGHGSAVFAVATWPSVADHERRVVLLTTQTLFLDVWCSGRQGLVFPLAIRALYARGSVRTLRAGLAHSSPLSSGHTRSMIGPIGSTTTSEVTSACECPELDVLGLFRSNLGGGVGIAVLWWAGLPSFRDSLRGPFASAILISA